VKSRKLYYFSKLMVLAVFGASLWLSGQASAAVMLECNSCSSTQASMKTLQYGKSQRAGASNTVYVFDYTNYTVYKYQFLTSYEGGDERACSAPGSGGDINCQKIVRITTLMPEEPAFAFADAAGRVYRAEAFSLISISPPQGSVGFPTNAYDDMQNAIKRKAIDNFLQSNSLAVTYKNAANAWNTYNGPSIFPAFKIIYSDGSTSQYGWNSNHDQYEPVPGSYKDKYGNRIPQTPGDISNLPGVTVIYSFPAGSDVDVGAFYNQLNLIGVPVFGSPDVGGSSTQTLTCVSTNVVVNGAAGVGVECSWD